MGRLLFMLGLLGVGVAVVAGVALRLAAGAGALLMVLMWLAELPPAPYTADGSTSDSTNPLVNYHIIYAHLPVHRLDRLPGRLLAHQIDHLLVGHLLTSSEWPPSGGHDVGMLTRTENRDTGRRTRPGRDRRPDQGPPQHQEARDTTSTPAHPMTALAVLAIAVLPNRPGAAPPARSGRAPHRRSGHPALSVVTEPRGPNGSGNRPFVRCGDGRKRPILVPITSIGRKSDMNQQRARIVVGVDGSPGSRAALAYALRDAARRGAAVEVVAAFATPEYWEPIYGPPAIPLEEAREAVRKDAGETVRAVVEELSGEITDMPPVTVTTAAGGAADALLQASRGADLLVVGSRGHGGFSSMLLGSVSLQCTLHARCPVTVIRPTAPAKAEAPALAQPALAT